MNDEQILQALTEIFRENFDDAALCITPETSPDDIEEWDSLEQINLLTAVQERFDVKFTLEDVRAIASVGDILERLKKQG